MKKCKRHHSVEGDNAKWIADKRKTAGGYWTCLQCHSAQQVARQHRYIQRKKMGLKAPKRTRKEKRKAEKFRGPNQMTKDAAWAIYYQQKDAQRVIEQYAFRIATARLRYKVSKARPASEEEVRVAEKQIWEAVDRLAKDDSKKPWKYLQIKPEALAAWDTFDAKLQKARDTGKGLPNCEDNPGPYMDYDEDDLPTAEEAYDLCSGCPLLAECGLYAELERPAWGVHAGDVFVYGEIVTE